MLRSWICFFVCYICIYIYITSYIHIYIIIYITYIYIYICICSPPYNLPQQHFHLYLRGTNAFVQPVRKRNGQWTLQHSLKQKKVVVKGKCCLQSCNLSWRLYFIDKEEPYSYQKNVWKYAIYIWMKCSRVAILSAFSVCFFFNNGKTVFILN